MNKLFISCFLLFSSNLYALDWSKEDKERQLVYTMLHIVDWKQTLEIADNSNYHELNLLLGEHPSTGNVNRYMFASIVLNYILMDNTANPKARKIMQHINIGVKDSFTEHNAAIGIGTREVDKDYGLGITIRFNF